MQSLSYPTNGNMATFFLEEGIAEADNTQLAIIEARDGQVTQRFTRAYVWQRACHYALRLRSGLGVRKGDHVVIAMPDGEEFVAAFFGTLIAGAVAIPLNATSDAASFATHLDYTQARLAIVARELEGVFTEVQRQSSVYLDAVLHAPLTEMESVPDICVEMMDASDPAVMLFTGGTTGTPKGVLVGHRAFMAQAQRYAREVLRLKPQDRILLAPKLHFGYALGMMLFGLCARATTILFPEKSEAARLARIAREHQATILVNVPTVLARMVADESLRPSDFATLRLTTSAGEPLAPELYQRWKNRFGSPLLNGLGTAEMWHIFCSSRIGDECPGTVGRVVDGFEISIRDEFGAPVPDGQVGAMWVRGPSLAISYWRLPKETVASFPGNGWYASQDAVRRRPDGTIEYWGRLDGGMKVAGKFVFPVEIEQVVAEVDGVEHCAVIDGIETSTGLVKPIAVVIGADGLEEAILAHTCERFGATERYKIPQVVLIVREFPAGSLGKVDKQALKRQCEEALAARGYFV